MQTTIKNFIKKYNLTGKFIVAFSGGYDSMCLLDILNKLNYDVIAVHLNHNWRGDESLKEAENCKNFCLKHNIEFYTETLDKTIPQTETKARETRYNFFEKCANQYNSQVVFTAHNADDNAETLIYRIIKGTGIKGLQGICENRGIYYRPLLKIYREDIEKYCKNNNLEPNIDSSNSNTKYQRNFIRHEILPLMQKINCDVKKSINNLSENAKLDNEIIEKYLNSEIDFYSSEFSLQLKILQNIFIENNLEYDREKILNLYKFIEKSKYSKSGKTYTLSKNLQLFVNNHGIKVIKTRDIENYCIKIDKIGLYKTEDFQLEIQECNELPEKFPKDELTAYVELKEINFEFRNRRDGDIIYPLGNFGKQKIKKYLNEKKIPKYEKDRLMFLCSGNEVFWAAGIGLSEKIKVVNKPTHVLKFTRINL